METEGEIDKGALPKMCREISSGYLIIAPHVIKERGIIN